MRAFLKMSVMGLLCVAAAAAAGTPDFSGTWTRNEEKSVFGEFGGGMVPLKLTVAQTADSLSIERLTRRPTGEERTILDKLTLDGKECTFGPPDRPRTASAKWSEDAKSLVISTKRIFERDGNRMEFTSVETWKLSDDGKTLTLDITSQSPRGDNKVTAVFDKTQ
jgi:hypothetical protein